MVITINLYYSKVPTTGTAVLLWYRTGTAVLLRSTVPTTVNENALKESYLVANRMATAKKAFTFGQELIFPSTKDPCCEFLGEVAVKKIEHLPLSTSTVTRRIEEIAEDILRHNCWRGLIHYYGTHSRLTNLQILTTRGLFMCDTFIRRMCIKICYVHYLYQPTQQEQNCLSHQMAIHVYQDN